MASRSKSRAEGEAGPANHRLSAQIKGVAVAVSTSYVLRTTRFQTGTVRSGASGTRIRDVFSEGRAFLAFARSPPKPLAVPFVSDDAAERRGLAMSRSDRRETPRRIVRPDRAHGSTRDGESVVGGRTTDCTTWKSWTAAKEAEMTAKNGLPPVHPGEILREEMDERGLTANALALALGVPANRITAMLDGRRGVSADIARGLSRYLGTTAEFWLNLQKTWELRRAWIEVGQPPTGAWLRCRRGRSPDQGRSRPRRGRSDAVQTSSRRPDRDA